MAVIDDEGRRLQLLCGALAEQSAHEVTGAGLFSAALLKALNSQPDRALLSLPLDLDAWYAALPPDLLADASVDVLTQTRDVLPPLHKGLGGEEGSGGQAGAEPGGDGSDGDGSDGAGDRGRRHQQTAA